jgi:hypothetical protein
MIGDLWIEDIEESGQGPLRKLTPIFPWRNCKETDEYPQRAEPVSMPRYKPGNF